MARGDRGTRIDVNAPDKGPLQQLASQRSSFLTLEEGPTLP